jgi:hypothetical protein
MIEARLRSTTMLFVALGALVSSGCASPRVGYASWHHFSFSIRTNWQQFVGWSPVATAEDAATADREGNWWGDEVPVWPAR